MAQVSRSQPSRDRVRVQREVSPTGLRKEGELGTRGEEGTGQQDSMKHVFPSRLKV